MERDVEKERCSFCSRPRVMVAQLFAGPGVFICDECVTFLYQLVEHRAPQAKQP